MLKSLLFLVSFFIFILCLQKILTHFRILRLKKKVMNNPLIGIKEGDNNYCYRQKGYTLNYRIHELASGAKTVEWLSLKRRLTSAGRTAINIKKGINNLFIYQKWIILFRPQIFFVLIGSVIIFYFGIIETYNKRVERLKWLVASAAGVNPSQVQYIGNGWLEISAQRNTADRINEPVRYTVNPFKAFFSSEAGFVTRWKGGSLGHVTHPVVYNESGDVWINKEGAWAHGKFTKDSTVEWDTPQGTRQVSGHEISTQEKKLYTTDK